MCSVCGMEEWKRENTEQDSNESRKGIFNLLDIGSISETKQLDVASSEPFYCESKGKDFTNAFCLSFIAINLPSNLI